MTAGEMFEDVCSQLKVLWAQGQIMGSCNISISIQWPASFNSLASLYNIANIDLLHLLGIGCVVDMVACELAWVCCIIVMR